MLNVNKIIQGDTLEVLKTLPDESLDMVITSPPYFGLRSYLTKDHPDKNKEIGSESSMAEHLKVLLEIFSEVKRVLKPSGSFWLNYGDCYGTGSVAGSREGTKQATNRGSHYDPEYERPVQKGYEKSLLMLPERIALKMIDEQSWILRQKIIWSKQVYIKKESRTMGSAMPTSVKDRFNNTFEYLYHFTKNKKYFFDLDAVRIPAQVVGITDFRDGNGQPSRLRPKKANNPNYAPFNRRVRDAVRMSGNPQFKASMEEVEKYTKNGFKEGRKIITGATALISVSSDFKKSGMASKKGGYKDWMIKNGGIAHYNPLGKNLPNVWLIGTEPSRELHFARFSSALCEIPIKSSCPNNGIVLDIFAGSGTALAVAKKLGRNYLGIELNEDYIKIAEKRLLGVQPQLL